MSTGNVVKLSQDDLQGIKQAFMLHDVNKKGTISSRDIGSVIRSIGLKPSENEVEEIQIEVESKHGGECDLHTLVSLASKTITEPDNYNEKELSTIFSQFDSNRQSLIPLDKFRHLMTSVGEKFMDEEVDDLLKCTGCLQNGMVNYEKFIKAVVTPSH